jgi:hypothetical protein
LFVDLLFVDVCRYREFHVSYRKTSLGDSGMDSGSEQGSVVGGATAAATAMGQLSPPHIFHPEDNPLPLAAMRATHQGYTTHCLK